MSNDLNSLSEAVLPPPDPHSVNWAKAQVAWGTAFSDSLIELLDWYGVGSFQPGRLRLLQIDDQDRAELFRERVESAQGSVFELLESKTTKLVPWGSFESGDWLVSLIQEGGAIHETILVYDACYCYKSVPGNEIEILLGLFSGNSPLYPEYLDNTLLCKSQSFMPAEPVVPPSQYPIQIVSQDEEGNSVEIPDVVTLWIPSNWSVEGGVCDCFLNVQAPAHVEGYLRKNPTSPNDPVTVRDATASQNELAAGGNSIRREVEEWGVMVGADKANIETIINERQAEATQRQLISQFGRIPFLVTEKWNSVVVGFFLATPDGTRKFVFLMPQPWDAISDEVKNTIFKVVSSISWVVA